MTTKSHDPVPERVFGSATLLIDEQLTARLDAPRGPRILQARRPHLHAIGRRALECAIRSAVGTKYTHPPRGEWEQNWIDVRDAAVSAERAIDKLLTKTAGRERRPKFLARYFDRYWVGRRSGFSMEQSRLRDRRDALILIAASRIITRLGRDADRRRASLIDANSSKVDHEKIAFVKMLAETWVFLTGDRPGSKPTSEGNPFLRFVEAAWQDWHHEGGDTPSFAASLRAVADLITDSDVSRLAKFGPEWL